MTNQEQAFVEGFVKRASEYGYSESEAIQLLKAADAVAIQDSPMNVAAKNTVMSPINYLGDKLNQGVGAVKNFFNNFEATHPRVGGAGAENMFTRALAKKGNAPAPVSMPSRLQVMSQPIPIATPAPAPQLPAAIADPSMYERLGVNYNGNPNYISPRNKPNEADMMDVSGYRR